MSGVIQSWFPSVADDVCTITERGKTFEEVYCIYPFLKPFYMRYVKFGGGRCDNVDISVG